MTDLSKSEQELVERLAEKIIIGAERENLTRENKPYLKVILAAEIRSHVNASVGAAVEACANVIANEIRLRESTEHGLDHMRPISELEIEIRKLPDTAADEAIEKVKAAARLDYEAIFQWLLGENGEFKARPEGAGAYWWRTELRNRLTAAAKERK